VKVGEHLVKPEEVFKTKSKAVKQGHVPNCWFEASLAAVAESPEGHRLIADLITKTGNSNYRVTFPKGGFSGDCPWVNVTVDDLTAFELQDKALWARVLDCACQKKYPNNIGVEKTNGLKILTGMPVHIISPTAESGLVNETLQRVTDKKWPTIMGTSTDSISASLTPWHAYSLVAYDRDSQVATIRNPVGGDPLYFQPPDLEHVKPITENEDGVRLLGDGLIQVSLKAVVDNFNGIVWAER
jgi:hypothetical protein